MFRKQKINDFSVHDLGVQPEATIQQRIQAIFQSFGQNHINKTSKDVYQIYKECKTKGRLFRQFIEAMNMRPTKQLDIFIGILPEYALTLEIQQKSIMRFKDVCADIRAKKIQAEENKIQTRKVAVYRGSAKRDCRTQTNGNKKKDQTSMTSVLSSFVSTVYTAISSKLSSVSSKQSNILIQNQVYSKLSNHIEPKTVLKQHLNASINAESEQTQLLWHPSIQHID